MVMWLHMNLHFSVKKAEESLRKESAYEGQDVLMGSPCEDSRLVAEVQPPAQQAPPVGVAVVIVVDDTRETQRHVTEKGCVLHDVGIGCRESRSTSGGRQLTRMY